MVEKTPALAEVECLNTGKALDETLWDIEDVARAILPHATRGHRAVPTALLLAHL